MAAPGDACYFPAMTELARLQQEVAVLPVADRAELASFLLDSLNQGHHWVDDAEVKRRRDELESGAVKGLDLAEFRAACGR